MTNEELVALIQKGENEADNLGKLYQQNINFIRDIAKPYSSFVEMEDLLQEAYFGLMEAVKAFDLSLGYKFTTFSKWHIQGHLSRYVKNHGNAVTIPESVRLKIQKLQNFRAEYQREHGCKPDEYITLKYLGIDKTELKRIEDALLQTTLLSLNESCNDESESTMEDFIASSEDLEGSVIDSMVQEESNKQLWEQVDKLPTNQSTVIRRYYKDGSAISNIAGELGVSDTRTRQIRETALRKLKDNVTVQQVASSYGFDYSCSAAYHGSFSSFKEHGMSIVEHLVMKSIEKEERTASKLFDQLMQMV